MRAMTGHLIILECKPGKASIAKTTTRKNTSSSVVIMEVGIKNGNEQRISLISFFAEIVEQEPYNISIEHMHSNSFNCDTMMYYTKDDEIHQQQQVVIMIHDSRPYSTLDIAHYTMDIDYDSVTHHSIDASMDDYQQPQQHMNSGFHDHVPFAIHDGHDSLISVPMKDAIESRRYDLVHRKLRCSDDPNEEILFERVYMTGLEHAVYNHDWRMAIVFYMNSADPIYNCFDGRKTTGVNTITTDSLYHINENNGLPISGFKGLYCLLNPSIVDYQNTLATLILMENCYGIRCCPDVDFTEVIDRTKECMGQLNLNNIWNKEFCQRIYTICKCLHRVGRSNNDVGDIPHEICLNILDYVVDDILSFTIWKGLKFITDESVQSKLMQKGVYYYK